MNVIFNKLFHLGKDGFRIDGKQRLNSSAWGNRNNNVKIMSLKEDFVQNFRRNFWDVAGDHEVFFVL